MNSRQHSLFPSFAGVALADILANSVAIIIIMIVVTIFIKHEQDQERLEQVEDVAVLLSREIASSVVMNALPTSPPTRLHDYTTSLLDRNPQYLVMPIIELHKDYIQNYYTKKKIVRNELLLQNNRFDKYIQSLTQEQLLRLRVDVYSIRLFYIVMSILKSHNHSPHHWHFLAYSNKQKEALGNTDNELQNKNFMGEEDADEKDSDDKKADNNISDNSSDAAANDANEAGALTNQINDTLSSGNSNGMIPRQADLFLSPTGDENYPYNDLAFDIGGGTSETTEPTDLPGESNEGNPTQEESDAVFNALAQIMEESMSGGGSQRSNQTTISRFRSANPNNANLQLGEGGMSMFDEYPAIDFHTLLPALFDFMEEAQIAADNDDATKLAEYDFKRDILQRIPTLPPLSSPEEVIFFTNLGIAVQDMPKQKKDTVFVHTKTTTQINGRVLSTPINQRVQQMLLINDPNQSDSHNLPAEINLTSRLSLYPEIYQGLRLPLLEDMLILMPPQQSDPEEFRWRIVTLVSPMLDDFVTAFIYAAVDDRNLLIATEENALKISNLRVITDYLTVPFRQERWQILFYGIVAALILFGTLRRNRKIA